MLKFPIPRRDDFPLILACLIVLVALALPIADYFYWVSSRRHFGSEAQLVGLFLLMGASWLAIVLAAGWRNWTGVRLPSSCWVCCLRFPFSTGLSTTSSDMKSSNCSGSTKAPRPIGWNSLSRLGDGVLDRHCLWNCLLRLLFSYSKSNNYRKSFRKVQVADCRFCNWIGWRRVVCRTQLCSWYDQTHQILFVLLYLSVFSTISVRGDQAKSIACRIVSRQRGQATKPVFVLESNSHRCCVDRLLCRLLR